MKIIIPYLLLSFLLVVNAKGHTDPIGEILPKVIISNNTFVVSYVSNTNRSPYNVEYQYYQKNFDKMASRIGDIVETSYLTYITSGESDEPTSPLTLPEKFAGYTLDNGDGKFIFIPAFHRMHKGKPFMLKNCGKEIKQTNIEWGNLNIETVHNALLTEKNIVLLVTEIRKGTNNLELVSINKDSGKISTSITVGTPAYIYDFPVCSNMIEHNGNLFIAWVTNYEKSNSLMFSLWNPTKETFISTRLVHKVNRNTKLSIRRINSIALLAYHGQPKGENESKIITVKLDLTKNWSLLR